jgi:hypothetical protein
MNYSIQLDQTGGGNQRTRIWARINGSDVPDSTSIQTVQGPNGETLPFVTYFFNLNANDYVEFVFEADDLGVFAAYFAAQTGANPYPAVPSIIATAKIIGKTVGLTGATGPTGPGFTSITNAASGRVLTAVTSNSANAEANLTFVNGTLNANGTVLATTGVAIGSSATGTISFGPTGFVFNNNLIPSADNTYIIGTTGAYWKSIYVGTGSIHMGNNLVLSSQNNSDLNINTSINVANSIKSTNFTGTTMYINNIGVSDPNSSLTGTIRYGSPTGFILNANIVPSSSNQYSLGTTGAVWQSIYVSTGTVFIGPTGSLSVNPDGILSSAVGFQSPLLTTNKVQFSTGAIYFNTGSSTGCFIDGMRYNATGNHYVYYNSTNKELVQSSPYYFFSYGTSTQTFTGTNTFYPVGFSDSNIMYETFHHTTGSSVFTGTFANTVILDFAYSLQVNSTSNTTEELAAVLYLDGSPIRGSYRSTTVSDNGAESICNNDILVSVSPGIHTIELKAAVTNISVELGGTPNITAPTGSYTAVNLKCTRVI